MAATPTLRKVCVLLKPFKDVTELVSGEEYATSSLIMPLMNNLISKTKADEADVGTISVMKSLLYADLESR